MFTVGVSFLSVSDLFPQMFSQQTASFPLIPNYSWDEELLFVMHGLPRPVGLLLHRVLQKVKVSHLEWIHLIIIATSYIQLRLYQPGGDLRPCTGQPMQSLWSSTSDGRKTIFTGLQLSPKWTETYHWLSSDGIWLRLCIPSGKMERKQNCTYVSWMYLQNDQTRKSSEEKFQHFFLAFSIVNVVKKRNFFQSLQCKIENIETWWKKTELSSFLLAWRLEIAQIG